MAERGRGAADAGSAIECAIAVRPSAGHVGKPAIEGDAGTAAHRSKPLEPVGKGAPDRRKSVAARGEPRKAEVIVGPLIRSLEIRLEPQHRSIAEPEPGSELPIVTNLAAADHSVRADASRGYRKSAIKYVGALAPPAAADVHAEIESGPIVIDRCRRGFDRHIRGRCNAATS